MTYLELFFVTVALLAVGWALRVGISGIPAEAPARSISPMVKAQRVRKSKLRWFLRDRGKVELNAKAPEHPLIFAAGKAIEVNAETKELPEWIELAPFGRHPTRDKRAVQVFNAESADQVISWFNFWPRRIARLARLNAIRVWVGHPDFAPDEWPERIDLGAVEELKHDGKRLLGRVRWNADALSHVQKHKFPSVAWDCDVNDDGTETPAMLWSVGMWHKPNIKSVQPVINAEGYEDDSREDAETENEETKPETNMLKNIMAALVAAGIVKESDDENSILGAIGSMIQSLAWKREETARQAAMATQMRTALNAVADVADVQDDGLAPVIITQLNAVVADRDTQATKVTELTAQITQLNAQVATERTAHINTIVERAIETGRATKADEARLITELNADFDGTVSKLNAQSVQLNTKPLKLGGMKPGVMDFRARQSQINAEVTRRMDEQRLSYDDAFNAVKKDEKFAPLFEAMKQAE